MIYLRLTKRFLPLMNRAAAGCNSPLEKQKKEERAVTMVFFDDKYTMICD